MTRTLFDSNVLREAQDAMVFLAGVLEASTEYSIIGKSLDGTILLWNEGARRMYGYDPEEVIGKKNSDILHTPEDVAARLPHTMMDAALRDGKWEGVIGRIRKDGRRISARVVMTPRRDASGTPIGFLLVSKDISSELRFTEEIRKAKLFDNAIVGNAQEAVDFIGNIPESSTEYSIIGKDLDGKILLWNEGARRLYGYEPDEVVGRAYSSILHTPEDVAAGKPQEYMAIALRDGKWEGTIERVRKNHERFQARVVTTAPAGRVGAGDRLPADFEGHLRRDPADRGAPGDAVLHAVAHRVERRRADDHRSAGSHLRRQPADGRADGISPRRAHRVTVQELFHRAEPGRGRHPARAARGPRHQLRADGAGPRRPDDPRLVQRVDVPGRRRPAPGRLRGGPRHHRAEEAGAAASRIAVVQPGSHRGLRRRAGDGRPLRHDLRRERADVADVRVPARGAHRHAVRRLLRGRRTGHGRGQRDIQQRRRHRPVSRSSMARSPTTCSTSGGRAIIRCRCRSTRPSSATPRGRCVASSPPPATSRRSSGSRPSFKPCRRNMRSLIESNIDALMTTDPLGVITDVNQQMETLTGRGRDELIGSPFKQYFTDPTRAEDGIRLVLRQGRVTNYELTAQSKLGMETVVSYNATTFNDQSGKLQGVFAAARDVTERKRFEQTLQEKNVELEGANQAKDRFLASMSHELRTPLNAIIGFTGTLLMKLPGPLTADQQTQLTTIQGSARYLLSLINDLLDLAKIESGKVEVHFDDVSCQGVLEEVAGALRPLAQAKGLEFRLKPPKRDVVVRTDRRALSQIIINLTNNAIKFTDKGHIRLEVSQRRQNGEAVTEISVIDTGCGIRPADKARLFQAFEQLETTSARRHEGTGLGLHLSQKLASLLGGHITFDSEYGRGSTFTLVLREKAA